MDLVAGVKKIIVVMEHIVEERRSQVHPRLHPAADRQERRRHDHHRSRRVPAARSRSAVPADRDGARRDRRRGRGQDHRAFRGLDRCYALITANRNYSSWSLRPWVLMKVLGIPFEDEFVSLSPSPTTTTISAPFSPTGRCRVLIDGERRGVGLARDRPLSRRPPRRRSGPNRARRPSLGAMRQRRDARRLRRAAQRLHDERRRPACGARPDSPALARDIARLAEIVRGGTRPGSAGRGLPVPTFSRPTPFLRPSSSASAPMASRSGPKGQAWVERMLSLPAMREWERRARRAWREESHEAELAAAGTLIADYRTAR